MNFWTPEFSPWMENRDDSSMPWYTSYDWVEVWDYDMTNDDFTLRWRDDFDSLDTTRWTVSDYWSFDYNSTLFMAKNVAVENGNLVFEMYKEDYVPAP